MQYGKNATRRAEQEFREWGEMSRLWPSLKPEDCWHSWEIMTVDHFGTTLKTGDDGELHPVLDMAKFEHCITCGASQTRRYCVPK